MRLLFDTNVVLDVLLNREPWVAQAKALWQARDEGRVTAYIPASVITDIFYIARRAKDIEAAYDAVRIRLDTFEICPVDRQVLEQAAVLPGNDFEDNVQIICAVMSRVDAIVTRDPAGFAINFAPYVLTPEEALAQLEQR